MTQTDAVHRPSNPPGILRLAAPLIFSFWLRAAFTLVDRFFAGSLEDTEFGSLADASQAAIGLTTPIEFLMIACWIGTSNGLTKRLSEAMGQGASAKIAQLRAASVRITLVLAAVFLVLAAVIWFAPTVFAPADEPDVVQQFQIYASVLIGGWALTMFWSILPDSIVKAHHDTKTTMWAGLISSFLNIGLNYLFVFEFGLGIFGIAFSSVIGRFGGLGYAWYRANQHERRRLAAAEGPDTERFESALRVILAIAVPSGLTYVLMGFEGLAINTILRGAEDAKTALAAWSVFDGLGRFFLMPPIAIGVALLPLVARWRGAGATAVALQREVRLAIAAAVVYAVVLVGPLAWLSIDLVIPHLIDEPLSERWASIGMLWLPAVVLFNGVAIAVRPLFDAYDRPKSGLGISAVRSIAVTIPLFLAGGAIAKATGYDVIMGYYAAAVLSGVIGAVITCVALARIGALTIRAPRAPDGGA